MLIVIICPSCSARKKIDVQEGIINQAARGVTAINIPQGQMCDHYFIAYIDKNFAVRDCFIADFQIVLPQMEMETTFEADGIPKSDIVDVDLIKMNLPALTLTYLIRLNLYDTPFLFLYDGEFLHRHVENFFNYITKDLYNTEMYIENHQVYVKNKKHFKNYIVLDMHNIIRDKAKKLDPKVIKIERQIIQEFLAEYDTKSSLIILKNEFQKAYELSKDIVNFLQNFDESKKLTPKLLNNYFKDKYGQNISDSYLKFLIGIVLNRFKLEFSKLLSFEDHVKWSWFLK
jgi:hypothetical protein